MRTTKEERDTSRMSALAAAGDNEALAATARCSFWVRLLDDADRAAELESAISQYITQLEQEAAVLATPERQADIGKEKADRRAAWNRTVARALRKRMKVTVTSTADDSNGRCSHPHGFRVLKCEYFSSHNPNEPGPRSPTCAEHCIHWVTGEGPEQQNRTTEPDTDPGNKGLDSRKG